MGANSKAGVDIDADVRRFVAETSAAYAKGGTFAELSFPEQRSLCETVRAPWALGGPVMAHTSEHLAPTPHGPVKVRIYQPASDGKKPALIYLHGGGWTLFSLDTHDRVMREYAAAADAVVVGVDYALSPEAKFPVALEQVTAVVRWLHQRGGEFGVDVDRLAIGGDSAGAGLSLATAVTLRDEGRGDLLRALLLIYGAFDTEVSTDAARRYGGPNYMLSVAELDGFWRNYLGAPADAQNPLARTALADLGGLPPTVLTVPECDILTEQSLAMTERLRAAKVETRLDVYTGATHSFLEAVSIAPIAQRAIADGASWLRDHLASPVATRTRADQA
jgi:acetyl esterase